MSRIWALGDSHAVSLSTSIKTNLNQSIILVEIRLVQNVGFEVVVDQWLPGRRQTEDIEAINTGKVLHLALSHRGSRTAILLLEVIGSEVALGRPVSSRAHIQMYDDCIAYARVNTNLATCNVNTSEPDGAGLHRESGYEEGADSHGHGQRFWNPVGFVKVDERQSTKAAVAQSILNNSPSPQKNAPIRECHIDSPGIPEGSISRPAHVPSKSARVPKRHLLENQDY